MLVHIRIYGDEDGAWCASGVDLDFLEAMQVKRLDEKLDEFFSDPDTLPGRGEQACDFINKVVRPFLRGLAGEPVRRKPDPAIPVFEPRYKPKVKVSDHRHRLAEKGLLKLGTQQLPAWVHGPPLGSAPSGVLDALLEERREGR